VAMSVKKNDPLRLDVSYLVKQSPGTHKEFDFNFSQLKLPPDLVLKDLEGKIAISVTEDGVVAEGDLEGSVDMECNRCLELYQQPLKIQFTEIFSAHPAENSEEDVGEQPLPTDGSINLSSIFRDYASLDIPIRHLCSPECKGLCPVCGMNLNQEDCGHKIERVDPRLEGLRDLLENSEKE
jgi:uncharacterized protein